MIEVTITKASDKLKNDIILFLQTNLVELFGESSKHLEDIKEFSKNYIDNGAFFVAMEKGKYRIIGTIACKIFEINKAVLCRFYVGKEYRKKGIGTQLYKVFEQYVKEQNIRYLYLVSDIRLKDSHRLYEKNGWKKIEELEAPLLYDDNYDYLYKKVL